MSSKKTTKTDTTTAPSPFAMPFVSDAANATQGAYGVSQNFINANTPGVQAVPGQILDAYRTSSNPALASGLAGLKSDVDGEWTQIGQSVGGITPNYAFTAPKTDALKLTGDFIGSQITSGARKSADELAGIGTSYTAPTDGLAGIGSKATTLGDAFKSEADAFASKASAIPGNYNFDPTAAIKGMADVSTQVGGIPGKYTYDTSGVKGIGTRATTLGEEAAALPGKYTFGTGPVTADTSGLRTVADAARDFGATPITAKTGGLRTVGSKAGALPGQFDLGDTRNVNVDTSAVDRIGARAEGLPGQYDLRAGVVGSRSAPVYDAATKAYSIPGQFDLGDTRDVGVQRGDVDTLSGEAIRAGRQRVTPETSQMDGWQRVAASLPGYYQFGADETDSRGVARDAMSASDAGTQRMSSLSQQIGTIPGQYRVSYDGPNDIIGGQSGQRYVDDVLGGKYLNSNPYIDEMASIARQNAFNNVSSAFGRSGMTGSSNFGSSLGRGISEAETGLRYANYEGERGRMGEAANLDYNFAGLRTNTAANAAGQRMAAQQSNAGNALQAAGLQSQLAQSMSSNELQALGIRADIADAIANRTLQGQKYAADLGLSSATLGGDLATRIAQMRLDADTGNADRYLEGVSKAGDWQRDIMNTVAQTDTANADRRLTGLTAQSDLTLGASRLGGELTRDAADMDLRAATSDADRDLLGRKYASELGTESARIAGDLATETMRTRTDAATSDADREAEGKRAQATLALDSLGIERDVADAIMRGELDAEKIFADRGITALQVQEALARSEAQLNLDADTANADRTITSQRDAADFGLGANKAQADALGLGLDAERLGSDINRDAATTALDAGRIQADIARDKATTALDYTKAGADTELTAAELAQRAMADGQTAQLDATRIAQQSERDMAELRSKASEFGITAALDKAGLSQKARDSAVVQQTALMAQSMDLVELQGEFEKARIEAQKSGDEMALDKAKVLGQILNDRTDGQIDLAEAISGLEQADIPLLEAYLKAMETGATFPLTGASVYAQTLGSLLGDYVNQTGKSVQSGGGLGGLLGPLLSIGASFIPGVGPALGAATALSGGGKSLGAFAGMKA